MGIYSVIHEQAVLNEKDLQTIVIFNLFFNMRGELNRNKINVTMDSSTHVQSTSHVKEQAKKTRNKKYLQNIFHAGASRHTTVRESHIDRRESKSSTLPG